MEYANHYIGPWQTPASASVAGWKSERYMSPQEWNEMEAQKERDQAFRMAQQQRQERQTLENERKARRIHMRAVFERLRKRSQQ